MSRPHRNPRRGNRPSPPSSRAVALDVLDRIEADDAYANLALGHALQSSGLSERDRRFVTDLVYGTLRMRRACDFVVSRFLDRRPSRRTMNALRLGAYQLIYAGVPAHAAVAETVAVSPKAMRGLVNAILRKVAGQGGKASSPAGPRGLGPELDWPSEAIRLSVPDWVLDRLAADLGEDRAVAALEVMGQPAEVAEREDGYVQDLASQAVVDAVPAEAGNLVLDACAAPGGKATGLATRGAQVVAADARWSRLGLVRSNVERLGLDPDVVGLVLADGTAPPWRAQAFDHVLIDAPCSGLGTLRRRADLRWRVDEGSIARLSALQRQLVLASAPMVRAGGTITYAVCTLTAAESVEVDSVIASEQPDLKPLDPLPSPWEPWGRGSILLPQAAGTDGMCLFRYRRER